MNYMPGAANKTVNWALVKLLDFQSQNQLVFKMSLYKESYVVTRQQ